MDLMEGTRIKGRFGGGRRYFPGKITRTNSDGTFDILYDGNNVETGVGRAFIKLLSGDGHSGGRNSGSDPMIFVDEDSETGEDVAMDFDYCAVCGGDSEPDNCIV
jgi:hypothetical protein